LQNKDIRLKLLQTIQLMLKFSFEKKEDITGTFLTHKSYYGLLDVIIDRFTLD